MYLFFTERSSPIYAYMCTYVKRISIMLAIQQCWENCAKKYHVPLTQLSQMSVLIYYTDFYYAYFTLVSLFYLFSWYFTTLVISFLSPSFYLLYLLPSDFFPLKHVMKLYMMPVLPPDTTVYIS